MPTNKNGTSSSRAKIQMEEIHMVASSTDQLLHKSLNDIDGFDDFAPHANNDDITATPVIILTPSSNGASVITTATNGSNNNTRSSSTYKKSCLKQPHSTLTNGQSTTAPNNNNRQQQNGNAGNDDENDEDYTCHSRLETTESMLADTGSTVTHQQQTGRWLTFMNMVKANVGTGILAMPLAFKNAGLTMGVICTMLFCVICVECMQIVLRASHYYETRLNQHRLSYPSIARLSFHHSPLRRWARTMRQSVVIFLYIIQTGFCCVYIVFVARTIDNVIRDFGYEPVNIRLIEVMLLPFFLALVMVRQMNLLAKLMTVANLVTFAALGVCYQEQLRHLQPITSIPQFGRAVDFPRFFGTAIYAFEGIGCVLPVENRMRRPETFGGLWGILNQSMVCVAVLYATTGFLGYLAYGDGVQGSITYNLPSTPLYVTVKLGMALAIFFSYALQFYVPMKMITPHLRRRWPHNLRRQRQCDYAVRCGLMVLTLAFALFVPHLAEFIGLIGAFGGGYLALILPPIIDLVYRYEMKLDSKNQQQQQHRYGRYNWMVVKDMAILVFGVAGFILGTYLALYDIAEKLQQQQQQNGPSGDDNAQDNKKVSMTMFRNMTMGINAAGALH